MRKQMHASWKTCCTQIPDCVAAQCRYGAMTHNHNTHNHIPGLGDAEGAEDGEDEGSGDAEALAPVKGVQISSVMKSMPLAWVW